MKNTIILLVGHDYMNNDICIESPTNSHHWMLSPPRLKFSNITHGRCKYCNEWRPHLNYQHDKSWYNFRGSQKKKTYGIERDEPFYSGDKIRNYPYYPKEFYPYKIYTEETILERLNSFSKNNLNGREGIGTVYILLLRLNKLYVGYTSNYKKRMNSHRKTPTKWFYKYPIKKVLYTFENADIQIEYELARFLVRELGKDNIRGGQFFTKKNP